MDVEVIGAHHSFSQLSKQRVRNLRLFPFSDEVRIQPPALLYLLVASSVQQRKFSPNSVLGIKRKKEKKKEKAFSPLKIVLARFSASVYLPNDPGYPGGTGWSSGLTLRSGSTHLGSHPRSLTDCRKAWPELGFLPQFTHLQNKSYSELPHRYVSNLKVSRSSSIAYIFPTSF